MKAALVRLILLLCIWSVTLSSPAFSQSGTGVQRVTSALKSKFGHWVATGAIAGLLLTAPALSETLIKVTTQVEKQSGVRSGGLEHQVSRDALEHAVLKGDRAEVARLVEQGVFLVDLYGVSLRAAANGQLAGLVQLIDLGALELPQGGINLNAHRWALAYATAGGQVVVVEWLLDNPVPADQDALDHALSAASSSSGLGFYDDSLPVLMEAERIKLVDLLAARGANDFNWAYKQATLSGQFAVARRLVELGAGNVKLDEGLQWVAWHGDTEMASWLIERGAGRLNLALDDAARAGHEKMIDLLIAAGADDVNGALAVAALFGHVHLFEKLVRHGADAFDAALEYAMTYSDEISNEVVGELVRLGATDFKGAIEKRVEYLIDKWELR